MKSEDYLWYKYKTEVWPQTTTNAISVHNAMKVLRSISSTFNYASTPVTSGKWLFEETKKRGGVSFNELINHNYLDGYEFTQELSKKLDNVLFPGDLAPREEFKWSQSEFQALWLSVIAEKSRRVIMNNDWEYSNGCAEELTHVFQLRLGIPEHQTLAFYNTKNDYEEDLGRMKNIAIVDRQMDIITLDNAIERLEKSIPFVASVNYSSAKLDHCLLLLKQAKQEGVK